MSLEVVSIIVEKVPSLKTIPQNVLSAVFIVGAIVAAMFILFVIFDFFRVEAKDHKAPNAHQLIKDLQRTMVKERKGTSTQNWIMILLTLVFISVSIFGGEFVIDLVRKLSAEAPQVIDKIRALGK